MADADIYTQQVQLLVRTLPFVARQPVFALKGGTAINLFLRDKQFLMSIKRGKPDWALHPVPGIDQLPAVQWKLQNVLTMSPAKHRESLDNLEQVLNQL